ncbi:hypothetical protein [Actinokineospora pegani]|uniref:hypothetical protein n=1 Tax=Actinokineospora pegani TaxID=2654637 RepID=UPI0012EA2E3C|nr:hypothetical protein [Actinokineospora pegani]
MSGYAADTGALDGAATRLRATADALAEVTVDPALAPLAGPPRLAGALAAFTEDTRAALTSTTTTLADAATALAAAGAAYAETEAEATAAFRGHLR